MKMKLNVTRFIREKLPVIAGLLYLTLITSIIFIKVYDAQQTPYMDEIFHIPQAQLYCQNVWTKWDPKITTLPGLYLVSYILLKPLEVLRTNVCSVYGLRFINILGTITNFLLAHKIMLKLHYSNVSRTFGTNLLNVISAINVAAMPTLYFFTFLYYTDVWSTAFVLLMYHFHLHPNMKNKIWGFLSGVAAVMMRQTNVIWVGFILLNEIWSVLTRNMKKKKVQDEKFTLDVLLSLRRYIHFPTNTKSKHNNIFKLAKDILKAIFPHLTVCVLFVVFVFFNGSIVVGDKEAHAAIYHPMQVMYFLDFTAFIGLPFFVFHILKKGKSINWNNMLLLSVFAVALSEINKLEHPYLLADNRHLAFYVWKRIFGHDVIRRVVIPTYGVAAVVLFDLMSHCNFMFKLCLTICVFLNLCLQHLFEMRYFIVPFIICRLQFRQNVSVWLEFLYFVIINIFTIHIFLNRPFFWASEPQVVQRFIW